MGSKSLVSHDCLSAWEVILPERLDPIKRFAKIERNFDLNHALFQSAYEKRSVCVDHAVLGRASFQKASCRGHTRERY